MRPAVATPDSSSAGVRVVPGRIHNPVGPVRLRGPQCRCRVGHVRRRPDRLLSVTSNPVVHVLRGRVRPPTAGGTAEPWPGGWFHPAGESGRQLTQGFPNKRRLQQLRESREAPASRSFNSGTRSRPRTATSRPTSGPVGEGQQGFRRPRSSDRSGRAGRRRREGDGSRARTTSRPRPTCCRATGPRGQRNKRTPEEVEGAAGRRLARAGSLRKLGKPLTDAHKRAAKLVGFDLRSEVPQRQAAAGRARSGRSPSADDDRGRVHGPDHADDLDRVRAQGVERRPPGGRGHPHRQREPLRLADRQRHDQRRDAARGEHDRRRVGGPHVRQDDLQRVQVPVRARAGVERAGSGQRRQPVERRSAGCSGSGSGAGRNPTSRPGPGRASRAGS
jgi:hypothetical protein